MLNLPVGPWAFWFKSHYDKTKKKTNTFMGRKFIFFLMD